LETTPINWYLQEELHFVTTNWYGMTHIFISTFLFEIQHPTLDQVLQIIIQKVFEEAPNPPLDQEKYEWIVPLQQLQECYNINFDKDDEPRDVNILETEGKRNMQGPRIELPFFGQQIKIKKVNTGNEQTPKLENVGDYWDDATISMIIEPFPEY
jgi:hypothetical protein